MADLLTHVLVTYSVLTVASWYVDRLDQRWIAVAMGGSAIPDLVKARIVIDDDIIETLLGIPFNYAAISTLGGVVVIAAAITMLFARDHWRLTYGYLVLGGISSLLVDGMRVFADGRANQWLFPFTWWRPPTPSLYVTSDLRIAVGVILVTALIAGRQWRRPDTDEADRGRRTD